MNDDSLVRVRLLARQKGFVIRFLPSSKLYGYAGMNSAAAEELGYPRLGERVIVIDQGLVGRERARTIFHEMVEYGLMRDEGLSYWDAHKVETKKEASL